MKKYTKLYNTVKEMILTGELQPGDKVPSIRKAAEIYGISLTTVQNAYFELCADGYIIAHSKSGYFASGIAHSRPNEEYKKEQSNIIYDLSGGVADEESFDFCGVFPACRQFSGRCLELRRIHFLQRAQSDAGGYLQNLLRTAGSRLQSFDGRDYRQGFRCGKGLFCRRAGACRHPQFFPLAALYRAAA